jgi:putative DNA primase/helicase
MKGPTQAQQLQEAVTDAGVELFHDSQHRGFASFPFGGHVETWPLRSGDFRRFLALAYYRKFGTAVRREVIAEQLEILQAEALFEGPQQDVHVRLAPTDGGLVLDLGGADWSVIEVDARGWRWLPSTRSRLIRPSGFGELPTPERGGSVDQLRPFLNVADDDQWRLLVAFLLGIFHPTGLYSVLGIHGEQGSAKSTTERALRTLVDPRDALDRTAPRDERDLAVHAARNLVVALDNLS